MHRSDCVSQSSPRRIRRPLRVCRARPQARSTPGSAVRSLRGAPSLPGDRAALGPGGAGRARTSHVRRRAARRLAAGGKGAGVRESFRCARPGSLFGCCRHIMATRGAEAARGGGSSGGGGGAAGRNRRHSQGRGGEEAVAGASGSPEVRAARRGALRSAPAGSRRLALRPHAASALRGALAVGAVPLSGGRASPGGAAPGSRGGVSRRPPGGSADGGGAPPTRARGPLAARGGAGTGRRLCPPPLPQRSLL